jgi:type IV pilus assembly protein PilB
MIDQHSVADLLARIDLFAGLPSQVLEAIARVTKVVHFEPRTTVVRQGEPGGDLYILAQGAVAVVREDPAQGIEHVVKELRAPEFFGEMSLLSGSPRAATIRTLEETVCVVLAAASYESLLDKLPVVAVQISRYLARRLDQQMGQLGFRFAAQQELVFEPELYSTFSESLLRRLMAIPLRLDGSTLTVAMTRPHDVAAVAALRQEVPGLGIQPIACAVEDYEAFVERYLPVEKPALVAPSGQADLLAANGEPLPQPLARLLSSILENGRDRIIVEVSAHGLELRSTTAHGCLDRLDFPLDGAEQGALIEQLASFFGEGQGGSALCHRALYAGGKRCQLSLSRLHTLRGDRYSLGLADPHSAIPSPSLLWPSDALRATVSRAVAGGGGAVLVTGAARSGRSTTLYSLLRTLESDGVRPNAITLESEPLLSLEGVAQVQLSGDLGHRCDLEDLSRLMKVALAQAPDVLLVDEPRPEDLGTILEAAEDGLTVLTTIKGGDPLSTLASLQDTPLIQFDNLKLLLGQQLLRRICSACRQEYSPSSAVLSQLELSGLGTRNDRYYRGAGCARCRGTGSFGRVANCEVVQLNGLLSDMLRGRRSAEALRKAASSNGLLFSFKSFARLLVLQGQILPTEALRLYGGVSRA